MSFLKQLFGAREAPVAALQEEGIASATETASAPVPERRLSISTYSDRYASVDELDLHGTITTSPSGRFAIVVGSVIKATQDTSSRRGGAYVVMEDRVLRAQGIAERPNDGKIADDGSFIINDWLHGEGLKGRFLGFQPGGQLSIAHEFSANLAANGISADGRYAACQTLRSPDSPDSCIVALFDLAQGTLIAQFRPESIAAKSFDFDTERRHLILLTQDGDQEIYGFDGAMLDRPAWLDRRIAQGDLQVIGDLVHDAEVGCDPATVSQLQAGLDHATLNGEPWGRARAYRLLGELNERLGASDKALAAYDQALLLDPQVGVSRKADKLRRAMAGTTKSAARRRNRFEQQADRLGIRYEVIDLEAGGPKQWRWSHTDPFACVEASALDRYVAEGWSGAAAEGGLILTLIKAASFAKLAERNADTFIEALYAQNVAFDEDRFDPERLVATIRTATIDQLRRNWRVISASAGATPAFYPRVCWDHVEGLFEALGAARLADIATVFATAPYDLRAGWPDLTLWRGEEVRFVEVKAPTDQMHASQTRLISTILVRLGYDVALAEVRART